MNLKKVLAFILSAAALISQLPAYAEVYESASAIIVEAENAELTEGGFKAEKNSKYSGGGGIGLYQTKEEESLLTVTFNIEEEAEYELHLLSTLGNTNYVSQFDWKIDDGEYNAYSGIEGSRPYSYGAFGVPTCWMKIKTMTLPRGEHTFTVRCDKLRTMAKDFMLCFIDCLYIVPTKWEWSPYDITKPFDKDKMKFEYAEGKISAQKVNREQSFSVTVSNKCVEETQFTTMLHTELRYKGQLVTEVNYSPQVSMNKWKKGKKYANVCNLTAPFNAPDGLYEVWTGILGVDYVSGEAMQKVGEIIVGELPKYEEPAVVNVLDINIPDKVERGEAFTAEIEFTANKKLENAKPYLAFYKDRELWYVAEQEKGININPLKEIKESLIFEIKEDLPDDEYRIEFGIHTFSSEGGTRNIKAEGGALIGERKYKPLSYGTYKPKKSGKSHFWYVNQNHAMIWDGEPYIPIGGMFCSNYIIRFNVNDPQGNKQRWDRDVEILENFKKEGLEHVYINSNRSVENMPAWALETYFELLEKYDIKYGYQLSSDYRESEYYAVRSQTKRISADASQSGEVTAESDAGYLASGVGSILDASSIYVVIDSATGEAADSGKGTAEVTTDGKIRYTADIKVPKQGEYKVYFTPWVRVRSTNIVDPFRERERLEQLYKNFAGRFSAGDNFRTFIDILSNESGFTNWIEAIKLTGGNASQEYASFLKDKYGSLEALCESWAMIDKPESFETAAELVPLYTEEQGKNNIVYAMDVKTNKIYRADVRKGILWDEYIEFREDAFSELNNTIADCIKSSDSSNVPVVYKHVSILENYNINKRTVGGSDGIGGEIYGDFDRTTAMKSYPYSEVEHSKKTMWFIITETNTEENMALKTSEGPVTYESKEYMHEFFDQHINDGAKGIYDFVVYGDFMATLPVYSYHSKPETYQWSREYREKTEKNADKIANTPRGNGEKLNYIYPGGQSWWYMPNKRNAVSYDDDYVSTRVIDWNGVMTPPAFDPTVDKNILLVNLENSPATKHWGPKLNDYLANMPENEKVVYLGLRKDLGSIPEIDKYFTDEFISEGDNTIQVLRPSAGSEIICETNGKPWALRDGNIYIISNTGWNLGVSADNGQCVILNSDFMDSLGLTQDKGGKVVKEEQFSDINGHWAKSYIEKLADEGVVSGREQNVFAPDEKVTRAEFLQMSFASVNMTKYEFSGCYDDVTVNDWFANVMQTANEIKIIAPQMISEKNIYPNEYIKREEAFSILSKMCILSGKSKEGVISGFIDKNDISAWAAADIKNASALGFVSGDSEGYLNPKETLTRAEAAAVILRFRDIYLSK